MGRFRTHTEPGPADKGWNYSNPPQHGCIDIEFRETFEGSDMQESASLGFVGVIIPLANSCSPDLRWTWACADDEYDVACASA